MNWLEIEQQLERFWKGETSLAEEKQLKSAFSREDVPAHLQSFKNYFSFIGDQKTDELPNKNFEAELTEKLKLKNNRTFRLPRFLPYAASFLLLVSSMVFLYQRAENNSTKYEPLTAKEVQIAQKYMGLLSKNLEQSLTLSGHKLQKLDLLNKGAQTIQQYENAYQKQIKNLNRVEDIDHSLTRLKYLKTFETNKIVIAN